MLYELVCGHCGYEFVLDGPLPHTVKCAVCGGMLTLAVPVPLGPAPAPPPLPPPAPVPADDTYSDDSELAEPWPVVRTGMNTARSAAEFALATFGFVAALVVVVTPFATGAGRELANETPTCLGVALLFPAIIHVGGQWSCMFVPRPHGGRLLAVCLALQVCSLVALEGIWPRPGRYWFVGAGAAAGIVSVGYWLAFLAHLGRSLGAPKLVAAARDFRVSVALGALVLVLFLALADFAARAQSTALLFFGRAGVGLIGFLLLRRYTASLRVAVRAIDRRAPRTG